MSQNGNILDFTTPAAFKINPIIVDIGIVPGQWTGTPFFNVTIGFFIQIADGSRGYLFPHKASVISSTRWTETPARYISIRASSTLFYTRSTRSRNSLWIISWFSCIMFSDMVLDSWFIFGCGEFILQNGY